MNRPGFNADASVYKTNSQYRIGSTTSQTSGIRNGITLAGTCTCTDPHCTWTCPRQPPTCPECQFLAGCNLGECRCERLGGFWRVDFSEPNCRHRCFFLLNQRSQPRMR